MTESMIDRRNFVLGLIAAPAIVKFASIMPVRGIIMPVTFGPFEKSWFRYAITYANGNYGEWTGSYKNGVYDFGEQGVHINSGDTLTILDGPILELT